MPLESCGTARKSSYRSPERSHERRIALFSRSVLLLALFVSVSSTTVICADELKPSGPPPTPAQAEFQKGRAALDAGKYAEAQLSFQKSMQLDPKLLNPLLGMAELNIKKNNAAAADEYLQKATVLGPKDANVWTIRGHYLFFRKDYASAEKAFKMAISLDAKLERPHYELGDLYMLGFHKPDEAANYYKEALAINPTDSRVHYTLANALAETGHLDEAQAQLEESTRLDPKNPLFQDSLGDFYLRRGKFDQAELAYARAIATNPQLISARIGMGDVYVGRKDFDRAIAKYQEVLQIAPKATAVLVKIGVLRELKSEWTEAEQAYRQALDLDPKLAVAANNLAWLLNEHKKQPAEALKWANVAVRSAPKDANFQDTLGWVLRANGDSVRALAALKQANVLAPQNPGILYHLGVLYQEAGNPLLASENYSKALAISTKFDGAGDAQTRLTALHAHQ